MLTTLLGTPSRERFAHAIIEAAKRANAGRDVTYDGDRFRLAIGDGDNHFNLHNVYQEFVSAGPWHRRTLLKRYARMIGLAGEETIPESFRAAQGNLLPRVRERSFHALTKLHLELDGVEGENMANRVLSDHLVVELAFDLPDTITVLSESTLEKWGVGLDLALDVAYGNLRKASPKRFQSPAPGVFLSAWRDHYDASRLLLVDMIRELDVRGDPVAMVPHRDALIVTGSEDERGLAAMAELTEKAASAARFMTGIPVRLSWDEWVPFRLPEEHPLHQRYEILRAQSILRDYDEQAELLGRLHEKTGDDIFVASYTPTRDDRSGRIRSHCVWSKDVVSLLPRADVVYFYDHEMSTANDEAVIMSSPWDVVEDVVGNLMKPQELSPPRYLVASFPSPDQLAELARRSGS